MDRQCNCQKILPDGVIYEQNGSEYTCSGYDTIVLALGVKANNPLEEAARALGKQVFVIGDAAQPGPANKATEGRPGSSAEPLNHFRRTSKS